MRLLSPSLAALLMAVSLAGSYAADVPSLFETACLTPDHDASAHAAAAEAIGAEAEVDPSLLGIVPPLMIPESVSRWVSGDPDAKAASDMALIVAQGTAMDQPATGCLVMGYDTEGKISTVLDLFETVDRIDAEPGDIGPPYRYWLVDGVAGPGIFAAAVMQTDDQPASSGLMLALIRLDDSVFRQLSTQP